MAQVIISMAEWRRLKRGLAPLEKEKAELLHTISDLRTGLGRLKSEHGVSVAKLMAEVDALSKEVEHLKQLMPRYAEMDRLLDARLDVQRRAEAVRIAESNAIRNAEAQVRNWMHLFSQLKEAVVKAGLNPDELLKRGL